MPWMATETGRSKYLSLTLDWGRQVFLMGTGVRQLQTRKVIVAPCVWA